MKNLRLILIFFYSLTAFAVQGQKAYTIGVATHHLNFWGWGNMDEWQHTWAPAKLMVGIPITEKLSAYPTASLGVASYGDLPKDRLFWNMDANLKYDLTQTRLQPYLMLGYGITHVQADNYDKDFYGGPNLGVGINYWLQYNIGLTLQNNYTVLPGYHNYHQVALGIVFRIAKDPSDCDKDGFLDDVDACPTVAGTVNGCPDRDGDTVLDKDDACPDVAGIPAAKGCPDKDGDGIVDDQDQCPDEAGTVELKGCPDSDGDGIINSKDDCPKEAGQAETNGCPDKDNDKVLDKDDACPTVPGIAALKGCPDRDGDGVADNNDRCPDEPGLTANKGCPAVKKEEIARIEKELSMQAVSIQFVSAKADLRSSSFASLDYVIKLMNEYPFSNFRVEGHTDNIGNHDANVDLSQRRADVIRQYFISKGVDPDRISTEGHGPNRPIADNKTADGRAKNRRSEIHLNN